jgi:predicted site-specific integrase-resolvase
MKLRDWAKKNDLGYKRAWDLFTMGKIPNSRKLPSGSIVVANDEVFIEEKIAVYARVSSSENKTNLEKQAERLVLYCNAKGWKVERVIKEIGSGLNDNRKQLEKLLMDKSVTKIVVEHSDRFSRFGMNYIEKLMDGQGRKIEIINKQSNDRDDLMQDFVSIITSFTARLYGQRRTKRKTEQLIKELEKES